MSDKIIKSSRNLLWSTLGIPLSRVKIINNVPVGEWRCRWSNHQLVRGWLCSRSLWETNITLTRLESVKMYYLVLCGEDEFLIQYVATIPLQHFILWAVHGLWNFLACSLSTTELNFQTNPSLSYGRLMLQMWFGAFSIIHVHLLAIATYVNQYRAAPNLFRILPIIILNIISSKIP